MVYNLASMPFAGKLEETAYLLQEYCNDQKNKKSQTSTFTIIFVSATNIIKNLLQLTRSKGFFYSQEKLNHTTSVHKLLCFRIYTIIATNMHPILTDSSE